MTDTTLDRGDLLTFAMLVAVVGYVLGVILGLVYWRDATLLWLQWVEGLAINPNKLLPVDCAAAAMVDNGLVVGQINLVAVPLALCFLAYRVRADCLGREPITGLDVFLSLLSLALVPFLVVAVTCRGAGPGAAEVVSLPYRHPLGPLAYLLAIVIFANLLIYLPAFALSRLGQRLSGRTARRATAIAMAPYDAFERVADDGLDRIASIAELARDPRVVQSLARAAEAAPGQMSAEEFLRTVRGFDVKLAGQLLAKFKNSGLKSVTIGSVTASGSLAEVGFLLLYAMVAQGIALKGMGEDGQGTSTIVGEIPSASTTWAGELLVEIEHLADQHAITATVTFPGQMFAWGRGKRIVQKLLDGLGGNDNRA